jgi:hypothetical protein
MEMSTTEKLPGLYGSEINLSRVIGYCKRHGKYLTVAMLKQHECLGKSCRALDKKEHDYWVQREVLKARKKSKKNKGGIY